MRKPLAFGWLVSACLVFTVSAAAQEIVHALSGTVMSVNPQAKTIQINTDDGSGGQFNLTSNPHATLDFNKDVKGEVKPATTFDKSNTEVVVFYYGNNAIRNAVAVQDLGAGPFTKVEGTVVKCNKHDHTVSIKDSMGKQQTFQISSKAVADTPDGVVQADRFEPQKGDDINLVATNANGKPTAVFLHD